MIIINTLYKKKLAVGTSIFFCPIQPLFWGVFDGALAMLNLRVVIASSIPELQFLMVFIVKHSKRFGLYMDTFKSKLVVQRRFQTLSWGYVGRSLNTWIQSVTNKATQNSKTELSTQPQKNVFKMYAGRPT